MGRVLRLVGSLVGIAGVAFSITLLSRSMRSVQKIGGFCAEGGPYQIQHHCPKGVTGLLPLSIVGGLLFLALFAVCVSARGRPVIFLAWPALFLTLGWNFLDYAFNPPSGGGVSVGNLIPGVLFILMGGVPLVWIIPSMWEALTGAEDDRDAAPATAMSNLFAKPTSAPVDTLGSTAAPGPWTIPTPTVTTPAPTPVTTPSTGSGDVASELERLASLHRRGELTDTEYEDAKRRAIQTPGGST